MSCYYASHNEPPHSAKFPRLSRPVSMMRPEYDVVVVGSGYGGGVAASRMARAGKSVAILELGKEKWPGEYPSTISEVVPEFHVSGNAGKGLLKDVNTGKPTGLYHFMLGEGQSAFVGNGLGGTSLINANVFLRCDERTLAMGTWAPEIRKIPGVLDAYYSRAAEMLQPTAYPEDYPPLQKLSVLEKQAKALNQGQNFYRVPQTTFFHDGVNNAGVEMKASTGSGQDCTGVNDGSKNSVLMNYIPDAWNWGAEIFCECEVRYIHRDRDGNGYIVFFAWHGDKRQAFKDYFYSDLMWVRAKEFCFLGAGALGTTEILLRSQKHGLKTSRNIGLKLSGNGDILSFEGYNTNEIVNGIGSENAPADSPSGPTITGIIDNRGPEASPNVIDGYVIEEGCVPTALAPALQTTLEALPNKRNPKKYSIMDRLRHLLYQAKSRIFGPYANGGSVNRTQTYLIMSHDSNEAMVTLENDKPSLQFLGVSREEHVKDLHEVLQKATNAIGGTLINSPFPAESGQHDGITVHPLGGAIMSYDGTGKGGATNHLGQVFAGNSTEVHEGLVCVDGSVIPTALGVNPFATITALAERSIALLTRKRDWNIDFETKNGHLNLFGKPKKPSLLAPDIAEAKEVIRKAGGASGVRFTEVMNGHIYLGDDIDDFVVAESVAKGSSTTARLYLSVDAYNVEDSVSRCTGYASIATGTFSCGALSRDPLLVLRGKIQFFSEDQSTSDATNLVYKLPLLSTEGKNYSLNGYKTIDANMAFSISDTWRATTTLYTTITEEDGSITGRGILHISKRKFASEIRSFSSTSGGFLESVLSISQFLTYFTKNIADYFLGPLDTLDYSYPDKSGYLPKEPPVETEILTAQDGVEVPIRLWAPTISKEEAISKRPLLFIPGSSVDHHAFALPTIPLNTIEYFTARGHACYVVTPRFGRTPAAISGGTEFDARLDILAAIHYVRQQHKERIYIICHCQGAIATAMGLLDGTIPPDWIQGLTCSQVFLTPIFSKANMLKSRTNILARAYALLAGPWFPIPSTPASPPFQRLLDQLLRFYPVGARNELCNSPACHRFTLAYSRCWNHANLNRATHRALPALLGGMHTRLIEHVMACGRANAVLDSEGHSLVTPEGLERLRGLPVILLAGAENAVYDPMGTAFDYDLLRSFFGPELYQRHLVQEYGHLDCWMGKRACEDVYPRVAEHVEWCETARNEVDAEEWVIDGYSVEAEVSLESLEYNC
ncbi:uncharacterized protein K452DRAFT_218057 [Aplosporella prunicola CBS 121167]|uniref:Cholesterol oxidase n=1 Tax=Aplosporella prunicola CBS 121167 TaxID=1176127 RepID=A0A6A6BVZ7_9PEZI|nr:uncharacterized protein K452DRAFT_218057 [Aplosporella prunicola CBS 121167]KAF2147047.1 hypothetical protein K452DRAFT_218057 [Aplosporella prunicola CBS 121167]